MAFGTAVQLNAALLLVMEPVVRPVGSPQSGGVVMEKLVLLMSKKMLPMASILILAVVLSVLGITTAWLPSLGVLSKSTVGKVCPPSVLSEIFTLAQLMGAMLVLFTVQVTVCVEPPAQLTAVLGAETPNGPAVPLTVTTISAKDVCPTSGTVELYGALSQTVSLKFKVRATELRASMLAPASPPASGPVTAAPARMVASRGNKRVGEVVGLKEIQLGPVVLVALATLDAPVVVELSFCSQLYVSTSPSASVALPVKAKGVLLGIV